MAKKHLPKDTTRALHKHAVNGTEPSRIRRKTNLRECPVAGEADWGLCFMITLSFALCNRSKLESVPASHSSHPMFYKYLNPSTDKQKEKKPSLLTRKNRKRLACDVKYTSATHAGHANDVTDLVKMGLLTAIHVFPTFQTFLTNRTTNQVKNCCGCTLYSHSH